MIIDVPTSSVALAISQVSREKGKLHINTGAATADLTGKACSPNTIHWLYDTWMLANGTGKAVVQHGGTSWFFLTADYEFGQALERDTEAVILKNGGKVLGKVRHPLATQDFSSFLLQAQASKAKVIGLANAGGDTTNSIKQAYEFGIVKGGQTLAGLLVFLTDIHSLGLEKAQGLYLTETFYWDLNDQTRTWSKRFAALNNGKYPSMDQAGVYAGIIHYLKAIDAAKTDDGTKITQKMKDMPIINNTSLNLISEETKKIIDDMYNMCSYYYIYGIISLLKVDLSKKNIIEDKIDRYVSTALSK
jgi:branched-chain amino acid transport system substrate-binding protein